MKRLIATVAVIAIAGAMLVPASTASAQPVGAAVGICNVHLDEWPAPPDSSAEPCEGDAVGAVLPDGPICVPMCDFSASVEHYTEDCFLGEPPLLGEADGTLTLDTTEVADYDWLRIGVVAVILLNEPGDSTDPSGAGVAAFVPDVTQPLGTCETHLPLDATVAGLVAAAQA